MVAEEKKETSAAQETEGAVAKKTSSDKSSDKKEVAKKSEAKASKKKKGKKKVSFMKGVKQEFKKITWPDKESLTKQSVAVVTVTVLLAIMIALLDTVFQYGVDWLIQL